jgi:small-conductance mechanosensitive channel
MKSFLIHILAFGIYGNSVERLQIAALTFCVFSLIFVTILPFIFRRLMPRISTDERHIGVTTLRFFSSVSTWVWEILALAVTLRLLILPARIDFIVTAVLLISIVILSILLLQRMIEYAVLRFMHVPDASQGLPTILRDVIVIVLWILGILLVLSNLGVNVTSLIAGLGISGIAIALASQKILSDIFSSFSIYFDKPFREGDYIITGEHSGFVRKIGLKTTRIQAVQGEEVVIPNQELTQARVRNFKRMQERHVEFDLLIAPDTSIENLRKVPDIIRGIIEHLDVLRFDRATLTKISKAAITFNVVYDVKNSDHVTYINLLQEINLQLLERLRNEGIFLG